MCNSLIHINACKFNATIDFCNHTGEVGEPPLSPLGLINESPRVTGRNVEVDLSVDDDIEAVECQVIRLSDGVQIRTMDCKLQLMCWI